MILEGRGCQATWKRGLNNFFFFFLGLKDTCFSFHKAKTQTPLGRLLSPSIN